MEADVANVTNEVLASELRSLSVQVGKLDIRFEQFASTYARNDLLELRFKELDTRLAQIELEIATVRKESNRATWKSHTLTAIFTAALVMLVSYVFNDLIAR